MTAVTRVLLTSFATGISIAVVGGVVVAFKYSNHRATYVPLWSKQKPVPAGT